MLAGALALPIPLAADPDVSMPQAPTSAQAERPPAAPGQPATDAATGPLAGLPGAGDPPDAEPSLITSPQPDIIVVLVDDMGYIDERVLGRLPNIRELWLENGLRFKGAYAETPLCCPNRAALLTGQHTRKHGVVANDALLLDPSTTIATTLDAAGYWTVIIGKYLNNSANLPDQTPDGWDRALISHDGGKPSSWSIDGVPVKHGYHDRKVADYALAEAVAAEGAGPLFMLINPRAPHYIQATKPWKPHVELRYKADPRCASIPPWKPPSYAWPIRPKGFPLVEICRSLLTTDEMVGALRAEMTRQGRTPVWVLASDNGMAWGAHGTPLKNVPAAGRMPLYFAGPGIRRGSTTALVSSIDIAPTLADLAGRSMPAADGISFRKVLSRATTIRKSMIEDHPAGGQIDVGVWIGPWWGVRTPQWHLVTVGAEPSRLYRLAVDPWELTDVAALYPEIVESLTNTYLNSVPW